MTATDPPIRGDHRTTWQWLLIVAVLFFASVVTAIFIVAAYPVRP